MTQVTKYTCMITTVDAATGKVGFVTKGDAQERQALVSTIPLAFRWPQVGETWMVRQENGTWYLDGIWDDPSGTLPITGLASDEMKLNASVIKNDQGDTVVATTNTGSSSQTIQMGSNGPEWVTPGTTTVPDATTTSKGIVELAGDIGGTATNVEVLTVEGGKTPVTTVTSLGGDLSGTLPDPTVTQIQGHPVSGATPGTNQVLEWNGTAWTPTALPSSLPPSGTASGDLSGSYPSPGVAAIQGHAVSATAPTTNQVLEWNGSAWTPTALPSSLPPSGAAGGVLGGTYPDPSLASDVVGSTNVIQAGAPNNTGMLPGHVNVGTPAIGVMRVARFVLSGSGSLTSFTLNHNLNTLQPIVSSQTDSSGPSVPIELDWSPVDANNITVAFATAPASGVFYWVVIAG